MKRFVARVGVIALTLGALAAVWGTPRAVAATTDCPPNITGGTVVGNVNVPTKTTCIITGAHITGQVIVQPHASLSMESSTVDGGVRGLNPSGSVGGGPDGVCLGSNCVNTGSAGNTIGGAVTLDGVTETFLCGNSVSGNVTVQRGRFFEIGDPTGDEDPFLLPCPGNRLSGVSVTQNVSTTPGENPVVEENVTTGSVNVSNNTSASRLVVDGNQIGGGLSCSGNTPPPDDLDARVPDPNTASGSKTGQCAAL
jgi:hypothetical protein